MIKRRAVWLALFPIEGCCDVLELARLKTPHSHDLFSRRAAPLGDRLAFTPDSDDLILGVQHHNQLMTEHLIQPLADILIQPSVAIVFCQMLLKGPLMGQAV